MTEYIYTLVYTIIYTALLNLFAGIFVSNKNINRNLFYLCQVLLVISSFGLSYLFVNQMALKQIFIILVNTIIIVVLYVAKFKKALVIAILYQGCAIAIEYLVLVILQYVWKLKIEDLLQNDTLNCIMGLLCLMVMFCVISVVRKSLPQKRGYLLTEMEWLRFSIFPLFCIITIIMLMLNFELVQNNRQGMILIWVVSGLVIMNIAVFSLLTDALKRENELAEYKVIQERGKNDTEMYQSMINNYNQQRKMVHEFKNHLSCMTLLINHGEYERLSNYMSQIQKSMNQEQDLFDTNHKLINMIINSKYLEACDKGILLVIKTNDLSRITMEDQDLVILLSNLINNAIEACENSENKVIKLKMIKEQKWLVVSVSNHYEQEPIKLAGKFMTRKLENVQYHGLGIENINDVIEKYGGTYVIKSENKLFQYSILIPM